MRSARRSIIATIIMLAGLAAVATAHGQSAARPAAKHTKTVKIETVNGSFAFVPSKITVKVGTTVVWTNISGVGHTVTAKSGASFNKQIAAGARVRVTFHTARTIHYYCVIHPFMTGTIIVHK